MSPRNSFGQIDEFAALINALFPSVIIAIGFAPLGLKFFLPKRKEEKVYTPSEFDQHLHSTETQNSSRETDIWQKTLEQHRSAETDEENRTPPKPQKRTSDKKVDATRPNRHKKPSVTAKRKTRKQIQSDLNQLKQLKEEGLISDETWEEKQKEILKDY